MASQVATTSADPSVLYALLRDGASWPEWSPLGSFELERATEGEPEGLRAQGLPHRPGSPPARRSSS